MVSKTSRAHYAIIPLFLLALLNEISYQMIIPSLNILLKTILGHAASPFVGDVMYGIGIAAFTVAVIVGSPLVGMLSDKMGRKNVLLLCLTGVFVSSLLFITGLYLHSISLFLIARTLSGAASASTAIVQAAVADVSVARRRSVHFSTVGLALTLGLILGPLLGGYFIHGFDVNINILALPFVVTAVVALLNMLLLFKMYHEVSHHKMDYVVPFSLKYLSKYLGVFFILEFSWSLYYLSLPGYLTHVFLYDSHDIGQFMASLGISMCVGLVFYRFVSQFLSNNRIIQISFLIFMASLFLPIELMIVPITWAVALSYVAVMGILSESVSDKHQGALMGTTLTTMALAWTVTGFGVKFLATVGVNVPLMVSGAGLLLGIILTL